MFNIGPTIPQERLESIPIQPETTRIEPTPHLGESYFNKLLKDEASHHRWEALLYPKPNTCLLRAVSFLGIFRYIWEPWGSYFPAAAAGLGHGGAIPFIRA